MSTSATETEAQDVLFVIDPPAWQMLRVRSDELPADADLFGPEPEAGMIASVAEHGVHEPLDLTPADSTTERGAYRVHGGTRRIKAYRRVVADWTKRHPDEPLPAHLVDLPAQIPNRAVTEAEMDVLMLQKHALRRPNVVADLRKAQYLLAQGFTDKDVARKIHVSIGQLTRILRLGALHVTLLDGAERGKISHGQAFDLVKLPQASQARLAALFTAQGKLLDDDVKRERQVDVSRVSAAGAWDDILATPDTTGVSRQRVTAPADSAEAAQRIVRVLEAHLDALGAKAITVEPDGAIVVRYLDDVERALFHQETLYLRLGDEPVTLTEEDFVFPEDDALGQGLETLDQEQAEGVARLQKLGPLPMQSNPNGRPLKQCPHGNPLAECGLNPCRQRRLDRERKAKAKAKQTDPAT